MSELKATPGPWIAQKDQGGGKDDWAIGIEGAPIDYVAVCNGRDAHLIAASPAGFAAAEQAYLALLTMPDCEWRHVNQYIFSQLRDYIALATNQDAQTVQEYYEDRARKEA